MPYKSIYPKNFRKEFRRLPTTIQETILKALEKTVENPYSGKKLSGKLQGLWRYRVGKYRVIYLIDEKESVIVFLDVGQRKSIYK